MRVECLQRYTRGRIEPQGPQFSGDPVGDFVLVQAITGDGDFRVALVENLPLGKEFFKGLFRGLGNATRIKVADAAQPSFTK